MKSYIILLVSCCFVGLNAQNPCSGNPANEVIFVNDIRSCPQYYTCVGETAHEQSCAHGLHFNPTLSVCDIPSPDGTCESCPAGGQTTFFPISTGGGRYECKKYRVCFLGVSSIRECSVGLQFNPETRACDLTDTVGCVTNTCPPDVPGQPHFLPHPTRCNTFFLCQGGGPTAVANVCPLGSAFNLAQQRCVPDANCWPNQIWQSEDTFLSNWNPNMGIPTAPGPIPTAPTIPGAPTVPPTLPTIPGVPTAPGIPTVPGPNPTLPGPNPTVPGVPTAPAPVPTAPGPSSTVPTVPTPPQTEPESSPTPGPELPTIPTPGPELPTIPGDCVSGTYQAHPTDCSRFFQCVHGRFVELACNAPLHFNPTLIICDFPFNAGCQLN